MTYTRKNLLALPIRDWDKDTTYDSIAIIPTGKKHDSGYSIIAIVGIEKGGEPVEIAARCDDICYSFLEGIPGGYADRFVLRTDMFYPSGITHVWSWHYDFRVGTSLSSTEVYLVLKSRP